SEIEKNEEQIEELWHHQFFSFTCEHSLMLFMLPPMTFFRLLQKNQSRSYPF
ncbi:transient receptor potential cation channel subfamily M member 3, partial [Biomphalaria glabrata]